MKVEIKGPGSCKEGVTIDLVKYLTLIYGNNGSGKTIISDAFYLEQCKKRQKQGNNDDITTDSGVGIKQYKTNLGKLGCEYHAYNTSFIKRNFGEEKDASGVYYYTVGENSTNAKLRVDEADRQKRELLDKRGEKKKSLGLKKKDLEEENKKTRKGIWDKTKPKYENGSLRSSMKRLEGKGGLHSTVSFFEEFEASSPNFQNKKTLDELEKEAERLLGDDLDQEDEIEMPQFDTEEVNKIEKSPLFAKLIVGTSNSPLATLISKHDNSSWVKEGLKYTEPTDGPCPFCQQKIDAGLLQKIKDYFDETYKQDIKVLEDMREKYKSMLLHSSTENKLTELEEKDLCTPGCKKHFQDLRSALEHNCREIDRKINEPNKEIKLDDTGELITAFEKSVEKTNRKITDHNTRIKDQETTKKEIRKEFWEILRTTYDEEYKRYKERYDGLQLEVTDLNKEIEKLNGKIVEQQDIIKKERRNFTNPDTPIDNINKLLSDIMGESGFKFVKHKTPDGIRYRIQRGEDDKKSQYRTLSEGEKTLVTFLYFLETCHCDPSASDQTDLSRRVIVIDDPISSLSQEYVFGIAALIDIRFSGDRIGKEKDKYNKIIVLTHSIYFFHELLKRYESGKKRLRKHPKSEKELYSCRLYRLLKTDGITDVVGIEEGEIQHEYEFYWKIIRDCEDPTKSTNRPLLAHTMRSILEYFFIFMEKKNLYEAISYEVGDHPFVRYMNRESHFIPSRPIDTDAIDPTEWLGKFKEAFCKNGYEKHYNLMMSQEVEASNEPSADSATEKASSEGRVEDSPPSDSPSGIVNTTGSSNQIEDIQNTGAPDPNLDQVEETAGRNNGNGKHREPVSSESASKRADESGRRSGRDGEHRETASSESVSKGTDEPAMRSNRNGEHRETASSESAAEKADPTRQNNRNSQATGDLFGPT